MDQNTLLILAYITGGILAVYSLFMFIFPSRKLSLLLKSIAEILAIVNNIFIYFATEQNPLILAGIITTSIAFVREIVYSFRNKTKVLDCIFWPILFAVINCCSLFVIFHFSEPNFLSTLPVIGSVFSAFALYLYNQKYTKIGLIISSILYVAYYAILIPINENALTIFSLLSSAAGLVSSVIGLVVLHRIKVKKEKEAVTE